MIMGKGKRVSQAEEEHVQKWRGRAPPWLRPGGQNKSVSQGPEDEEAGAGDQPRLIQGIRRRDG